MEEDAVIVLLPTSLMSTGSRYEDDGEAQGYTWWPAPCASLLFAGRATQLPK